MDFTNLGKLFLIFAVVVAAAGVFLMLVPKVPWLGRLPGDIVIRRDNFTFYFPLATCLILSLVLSLVLRFFRG